METVQPCNQCGAALGEDSLEGLCPKCLVKAGPMNELSMAAKSTVVATTSRHPGGPPTQPSIAAPEPSQRRRSDKFRRSAQLNWSVGLEQGAQLLLSE
jgi:hypothetical protein